MDVSISILVVNPCHDQDAPRLGNSAYDDNAVNDHRFVNYMSVVNEYFLAAWYEIIFPMITHSVGQSHQCIGYKHSYLQNFDRD